MKFIAVYQAISILRDRARTSKTRNAVKVEGFVTGENVLGLFAIAHPSFLGTAYGVYYAIAS